MTRFGFNSDDELIALDPDGISPNAAAAAAINIPLALAGWNPAPPIPKSILELAGMMKMEADKLTGVGADIAFDTLATHPDNMAAIRTATAASRMFDQEMGRGLPRDLIRIQQHMSQLMSQQLRIIADQYMPRTRRVQFRFPRSRNRRIQRKWMRDQRNWREEMVVWKYRAGGQREMMRVGKVAII